MNYNKRLLYYKFNLDWDKVERFVTDNGKYDFCMIEFGFRYPNDIFQRKIFFWNIDALKKFCIEKNPCSVELGITCPNPAKFVNPLKVRKHVTHNKNDFIWKRPLIFDWDIEHHLRREWNKCGCSEKEMCHLCWDAFGEPARVSLERALTHWMGIKEFTCVFSGGRGFHLWVLDSNLRSLSMDQRDMIVEKLSNPIENSPLYEDLHSLLEPYYEKYHKDTPYGVMSLLYTLDKAVTTGANHMSGLPWFPHARTGRLRVELNGKNPFLYCLSRIVISTLNT